MLSDVAEQFATPFWAYATQYYVGVRARNKDKGTGCPTNNKTNFFHVVREMV